MAVRRQGHGDWILKMTIDPLAGEIRVEELDEKEIRFEGSPAYGIAHELKHLKKKEIAGKDLSKLRFV